MAKWKIPVTWSMSAVVDVEAPDLETAMKIAGNERSDLSLPSPDNSEYCDGSWSLVYDDAEEIRRYYNGGRPDEELEKGNG